MNDAYNLGTEFVLDDGTLPFLKLICDGMPGGFFIYKADDEEELIFANRAMLRIFGCETEEEFRKHIRNSFQGIVHPDDYARVKKSIDDQIAGNPNKLDYVEYRIIRLDGTVRWVEDYGRFINTENYGSIYYVFVDDATERMKDRMDELEKVNRELQVTHAREWQYRKAILHNAMAFFEVNLTKDEFIYDATSGGDSDIYGLINFSDSAEGVRFSDFVMQWSKKVEEKKVKEYLRFFDTRNLIRCYEEGEPEQVFECFVTDSSEKSRYLQFMLLIGKNEFTGDMIALAVIKDITEVLVKQKLFKAALSEANAGNVASHTFLTNLSHDINTPLNIIRSFTEMISYNAADTDMVKYCLEKIRVSSKKLLDVVNESLKISHMESEISVLSRSECDLSDLLRDLRQRVMLDASEKQIRLSLDKSGVKNFKVYADTVRLEEVLWQMLDNAVKYTGEGGNVTLKVTENDMKADGFGEYVFEISDTGIGIGAEFLEHVFEPFKREDKEQVAKVRGSGLGLAVVKNIVDMMEGTVSVESEDGAGSRFTVTLSLPLQDMEKAEVKPKTYDPDILKCKHILIAEDNEINLEIERAMFEKFGCIVDTAENGFEALKMVSVSGSLPYDVVIMDIVMPVMDGYGATKGIRALENKALSEVPIIAVSSNNFEDTKKKAESCGMNAFSPKPIDISLLQKQIVELLRL